MIMKKLKKLLFVLLFGLASIAFSSTDVFARVDIVMDRSYIYCKFGLPVDIPCVFTFHAGIDLICADGIRASNPQDMHVHNPRNEIYVLDSGNNRVMVFDFSFSFVRTIDYFLIDGMAGSLNRPEGIFITAEDVMYIADTENNRILVGDLYGNIYQVFGLPPGLVGYSSDLFLPTKLVVDDGGRIYVIARHINRGILRLAPEGYFTGFIGAPRVRLSLFDRFWRSISTREQRARMRQLVPTEYSNLAICELNFIFGTIATLEASDVRAAVINRDMSGTTTPIKKLNSLGDDVLKRFGVHAPLGDLFFRDQPSRIIDVALGNNGMYSLLDANNGKVFTYTEEGILLSIFGNIGNRAGNFQVPSAIAYIGDSIVVLDLRLSQLLVFEPTFYGTVLLGAVAADVAGDRELSIEKWTEVSRLNGRFEHAFNVLGHIAFDNGDYATAMEYFLFSLDFANYSRAKERIRDDIMSRYFPVIFVSSALLLAALVLHKNIKRFVRYYKGDVLYEAEA